MNNEQNSNNAETQQLNIADVSCFAIFKTIESRYVPATGIFIGKVEIARYYYDGVTNGNKKYKVTSKIPTLKNDLGNYETTNECIDVCINAAKVFCKQLQHCNR